MSAQENITSKSAHVYLESLQGTIFDFFFLGGFVLIDPIREKKWKKKQKRGETDGKLTGVPYILVTVLLNVPTLCHGLRTYLFWLGPGAEFSILPSKPNVTKCIIKICTVDM